jgi:hypothetical protein
MGYVRDENSIPDLIDGLSKAAGEAVAETARDGYEQQQENWSQGKDATGDPWQPLSPTTIEQKGNDRILVDTGRMKSKIELAIDRDANLAAIGPTTKRSEELLALHEYGVPEQNLPARPVMRPTARYLRGRLRDSTTEQVGRLIDALTI